jgi:hypothetical protein
MTLAELIVASALMSLPMPPPDMIWMAPPPPTPLEVAIPLIPALYLPDSSEEIGFIVAQQVVDAMLVADVIDPTTQAALELGTLTDNWDGEGAARPSVEAIERAVLTIQWAKDLGLKVTDVDADVLGGVAVWLGSAAHPDRRVWVSCMNNGRDTIVMSNREGVVGQAQLADETRGLAVAFLAANLDGQA